MFYDRRFPGVGDAKQDRGRTAVFQTYDAFVSDGRSLKQELWLSFLFSEQFKLLDALAERQVLPDDSEADPLRTPPAHADFQRTGMTLRQVIPVVFRLILSIYSSFTRKAFHEMRINLG